MRTLCSLNHTLFSQLLVCTKVGDDEIMGMLTHRGDVFGVATKKHWESPISDFGYATNEKIIKEIHIKNKEDLVLKIKSENETKVFNVAKTTSVSKIRTAIKGKTFSLIFETENKLAQLSNPQIIFGLL